MYQASDLFKKAYGYAVKHYDYVVILSPKYGLLLPEEEIDPYELTLEGMSKLEQRKWSQKVLQQLESKLPTHDIEEVFFHTGLLYRTFLTRLFHERGFRCIAPLEGLSIGQQKAWYLKHI